MPGADVSIGIFRLGIWDMRDRGKDGRSYGITLHKKDRGVYRYQSYHFTIRIEGATERWTELGNGRFYSSAIICREIA